MRYGIIIVFCAVGLMSAAGVPSDRARGIVAAPATISPGPTNPPPPVPLQPADHETLFDPAPTLLVESGIPFYLYHFRVFEMGSIAAEGYSLCPSWNVAAAGRLLQYGHNYQWTCRVRDAGGWSEWFSPSWNFSVESRLSPPEPKLPQDGSVVPNGRLMLVVRPVRYPVTYRLRVWDGRTLVREAQSNLPWWQDRGGSLEPGRLYNWSCQIKTDTDSSNWFKPLWRFEVAHPPAQPATTSDETVCDCQEPVFAFPNPFDSKIELRLPSGSGSVQARIFGTDGRLVRSSLPFGTDRSTLTWDGRDDNGAATRSGTYLCRITGSNWSRTLTVIRCSH
ncbi:MAG: FlgD immunoglobulin-like domain containing protein [candidate division WOR-3 bacterium]